MDLGSLAGRNSLPKGSEKVIQLINSFKIFHSAIELKQTQNDKIDSAVRGLRAHLGKYYDIEPEHQVQWMFPQGSYANGTAVKPADPKKGEYDVDLVILSGTAEQSADDALNELKIALESSDTYKKMLEPDRPPCVRVRYADDEIGGFHVDLVPARHTVDGATTAAPLEVPRRGEGWHGSDPEAFTKWAKDGGETFQRQVMMLKRWRDENQSARQSIKSIVLQVLISEAIGDEISDAAQVEGVFSRMNAMLQAHQAPPDICNPVLPEEVLTKRWTRSSFDDFKAVLAEAAQTAKEALFAADDEAAHAAWRKLFGNDFPPYSGEDKDRKIPPKVPGYPQQAPNERYG